MYHNLMFPFAFPLENRLTCYIISICRGSWTLLFTLKLRLYSLFQYKFSFHSNTLQKMDRQQKRLFLIIVDLLHYIMLSIPYL